MKKTKEKPANKKKRNKDSLSKRLKSLDNARKTAVIVSLVVISLLISVVLPTICDLEICTSIGVLSPEIDQLIEGVK